MDLLRCAGSKSRHAVSVYSDVDSGVDGGDCTSRLKYVERPTRRLNLPGHSALSAGQFSTTYSCYMYFSSESNLDLHMFDKSSPQGGTQTAHTPHDKLNFSRLVS